MKVLFLDDMEERHLWARKVLHGHELHHVMTADEAADAMMAQKFDIASLDHDLSDEQSSGYGGGVSDGTVLAKWMATKLPKEKHPPMVLIHSMNPAGADRMHDLLKDAGFNVTKKPFTMWK